MSDDFYQEINLLHSHHIAKVPRLSFAVALCLSMVFLGVLMIVVWQQKQLLNDINMQISEIEKNNMFQQAQLTPTEDIDNYEAKLTALENQLIDKYQLWANYQKMTLTGKEGFSQHFYHIAQLSHSNLSLYEIDIYNKGKNLAIKGYARKAQYIPVYINELKKQKEFSEVAFGDLSIEKLKDHNVLRFSLEKVEEEAEKKDKFEKQQDINISDLMGMPLVNNIKPPSLKDIQRNIGK